MAEVEDVLLRRAAARSAAVSGLKSGVVAGIAIGCICFVLLAILVVVLIILYVRHLRKIHGSSHDSTANENPIPNQPLSSTAPPTIALSPSLRHTRSWGGDWGVLSSQEHISENSSNTSRQSSERKSFDATPPTTPGKPFSKRRLFRKRFRRSTLNSIPEASSGRSEIVAVTEGFGPAELPGGQKANDVQAGQVDTPNPYPSVDMSRSTRERTNSDNFSVSALLPMHETGNGKSEKSTSEPAAHGTSREKISIYRPAEDTISPRRSSSAFASEAHTSSPPTKPLPPLPKEVAHQQQRSVSENRISTLTASSFESTATSILGSPEKKRGSNGLSDAGLDVHSDTADGRHAVKDQRGIAVGPVVKPKLSEGRRLNSTVSLPRIESLRNSYELGELSAEDRAVKADNSTDLFKAVSNEFGMVDASRTKSSSGHNRILSNTRYSKTSQSSARNIGSAHTFSPSNDTNENWPRRDASMEGQTRAHACASRISEDGANTFRFQFRFPIVKPSPGESHVREKSSTSSVQPRNEQYTKEDSTIGSKPAAQDYSLPGGWLITGPEDMSWINDDDFLSKYGQTYSATTSPPRPQVAQGNSRTHGAMGTAGERPKTAGSEDAKEIVKAIDTRPGVQNALPWPQSPLILPAVTFLHQDEPLKAASQSTRNALSSPRSPSAWNESPPLLRRLSSSPNSQVTTGVSSFTPAALRTQHLQMALNTKHNTADLSPSKSSATSSPGPKRARSLGGRVPKRAKSRSSAAAARIVNRTGSRNGKGPVQASSDEELGKLFAESAYEDKYGDKSEEMRSNPRGGVVWTELDDLKDFWGTSDWNKGALLEDGSEQGKQLKGKKVSWEDGQVAGSMGVESDSSSW